MELYIQHGERAFTWDFSIRKVSILLLLELGLLLSVGTEPSQFFHDVKLTPKAIEYIKNA